MNTDDGIQSVRQWLHDCGVPYSTTVFLFYDRAMILAMALETRTTVLERVGLVCRLFNDRRGLDLPMGLHVPP